MKFILLILFVFNNYLFAQDTLKKSKDNAVKGIIVWHPLFGYIASLSYERKILTHSSLELYANITDDTPSEADAGTTYKNILFSYKYSFFSINRFLNNTWGSIYFRIATFDSFSNFTKKDGKLFGYGCALGKRMFFSKNKRMFFDLGLGAAPTNKKYIHNKAWNTNTQTYESYKPYTENLWIARFIFLLGYNF